MWVWILPRLPNSAGWKSSGFPIRNTFTFRLDFALPKSICIEYRGKPLPKSTRNCPNSARNLDEFSRTLLLQMETSFVETFFVGIQKWQVRPFLGFELLRIWSSLSPPKLRTPGHEAAKSNQKAKRQMYCGFARLFSTNSSTKQANVTVIETLILSNTSSPCCRSMFFVKCCDVDVD